MGLLTRLEKAAAERKSLGYGESIVNLTNPKLGAFFSQGSVTGKAVNDTTAMQVTTFFAGVRLLAETMGAFPSAMYRSEKNGNAARADDHPLHEILVHQPNIDMNGVEFREASTTNLAARGNAYSFIERRGSGDVSSLYPLPSSSVQVKRDNTTNFETRYGFTDRGKREWYPPEKIWHRRGFSFDGRVGLSPIQCAREAIGLALAGEEFNARLFAQGLMPSARVSLPDWLTDEQRAIADKKLLAMQGLANMGKPLLLEGGMKVESGLITPEEAQFLALRQFTVVEICRLLGIKPHMIAALERATDNNIEKLSLEFVMYTMLPHVRRDEAGVRKLLKPADRDRYFYRYNFEGLLRADSVARAQLYSILLQNGVFSRNEVRALENRNRSEADGMDDYSVQLNMTLIQFLEHMARANATDPDKSRPPEIDTKNTLLPTEPTPPVQIQLTSFDESVKSVAEAVEEFQKGQKQLKGALNALANSHDALHEATAVLAKETARNANASIDIKEAISELTVKQGKPRKAVLDDDGNVIGSEVVDELR